MPKVPTWIFNKNLFWLIIIIASAVIQFKIVRFQTEENDFCQHYLAIENFKKSQPIYSLFDISQCWKKSRFISEQYPAYPPTTLLFLYPLSVFSLDNATLIWDVLDICLYFSILVLFFLYLRQFKLYLISLTSILSLSWSGLLLAQTIRNFNLVLLFLIILSLSSLRKHQILTGFLIGVASLIKIWPIVYLGIGFINKRYLKFLLSGMVTLIIGSVLTVGLFGANNFNDYIRLVPSYEHIFYNFSGNLSLTSAIIKIQSGFIHRFFYPSFPPLYSSVQSIFILLYLFIIISTIIEHYRYYRISSAGPPDLYFALITILYYVFSPLSWSSAIILLSLPLIILLRYVIITKPNIQKRSLFFIVLGFFPLLFPEFLELPTYLVAIFPPVMITQLAFYFVVFVSAGLPLLINHIFIDLFTKSAESSKIKS